MTKTLLFLFGILVILSSCGQSQEHHIHGLTIDPGIRSKAEQHIRPSEMTETFAGRMAVYYNKIYLEYFQNDQRTVAAPDQPAEYLFKSFYCWKGDTLCIDGAIGIWGGAGFAINITGRQATLTHMLSSDELPTYAYHENDSLIMRLEVPCEDTKIVLSALPDPAGKQAIYGYVEFKSGDYYSSRGSADGQEILPRIKQRANMKIYFKSDYLNL